MKSWCVKEKKETKSNPPITYHIAKNNRKYRKSICASCGEEKTTMISNQEWAKQKN